MKYIVMKISSVMFSIYLYLFVFVFISAEYICGLNESWCHMLREHFPPGLVPQPRAAPDALPVSELPSRGAQHRVR